MNVLATQRGHRHYPSMLEDVEAHRPTEVDLITGALVREAHRLGVPVPLHETMYRLVKAKEASWAMRVCVVGCGAVGSLFAANLATLDDVEVWAYDAVAGARRRDQPRRAAARRRRRGALARVRATTDAARAARRATSGSSRRRRCTPSRRSPPTAHAFADGSVATVQNGIGNEEVLAAHVERVIRGTTFPAGKILEPGVVQWDVKGDTTLGPFEPKPARVRRDRAARGRVHARRHADRGGRGRARPAVAQGDLQRCDEPGRRAHRADARPRLRAARPARARLAASSTRARRSRPHRGSSSTPIPRT